MNAFQAPPTPPARPQSDKSETTGAQPLPPDAKVNRPAAKPELAPEPAPEQPRLTGEDMSGWAMGGSD